MVNPRDVAFIFKILTKDKVVSRDYFVGLNFQDFQQALFRLACKYKNIFNVIADKIKDAPPQNPPAEPTGKGKNRTSKPKEKPKPVEEPNEFEDVVGVNVKDIMKDTQAHKEVDDYGDLSKGSSSLIQLINVPFWP